MTLVGLRSGAAQWVHPDRQRIVKFFPNDPPERGDAVLVEGERCKVLACPVTWDGLTWRMGERGIKVKPDPLEGRHAA